MFDDMLEKVFDKINYNLPYLFHSCSSLFVCYTYANVYLISIREYAYYYSKQRLKVNKMKLNNHSQHTQAGNFIETDTS